MKRLALAALIALAGVGAAQATRIKDIVSTPKMRDNQLVGYGLVVGLQGSGDSLRNAPFTEQSLQSMLDRMGVSVKAGALRTRNVAAVVVTADLPPFANRGSRIDVTVSSMGDAASLMGGTLVLTPLTGADGQTYAVAQGQLIVSGLAAQGQGEQLSQGVPTAARVPGGGAVEREPPGALADGPLALELRNPDFRTATLIADAVNAHTRRAYGKDLARERDHRTVLLTRPPRGTAARFLAEIGDIEVAPDAPARVVVDARTGTIVIGQDVKISTVAVTHGGVTVRVTETPVASQPAPLSKGETVVLPRTQIEAEQSGGQIAILNGATLRTLVRGLNNIGLKPTGIIAILQTLKTAGALQAELVVQ
ncbi:MAG: flagellar basal body P-ring protein FlgI [Rhizobiales bacterium]|nr:flagellar basal body P-ring protein FlgI [Hyphomicrobiales bacterium]